MSIALSHPSLGQVVVGCAAAVVWLSGLGLTIAAAASTRLRERLWPAGRRQPAPALRGAMLAVTVFLGFYVAVAVFIGAHLRALGGWGVVLAGTTSQAVMLVAVTAALSASRVGAGQGWASLGMGAWRGRHMLASVGAWLCSSWATAAAALLCAWVYFLCTRQRPPAMALVLLMPALSPAQQLAMGALAVLVAPLAEEFLFRGVLFGSLRSRLGFWPAATLSSLFFGAIHMSPVHILPVAVLGLAMAWVYERSGSLWPAVGLHAIQNGTVLALFSTRQWWMT